MNRYTYLRVSSDIQEEKETEKSQRYALDQLFKQKQLELTKEFKDLDKSGDEYETRKGLQELIDELIVNNGSELYVTEQNRLTREPIHWLMLQEIFKDTKTRIFTIQGEIKFETPEEELFTNMTSLIDKYHKRKIAVVATRGIHRRIAEGLGWGPTPKIKTKTFNYWYYQKGITNKSSLALVLGVARQTVYNYFKKHNIPYKKQEQFKKIQT